MHLRTQYVTSIFLNQVGDRKISFHYLLMGQNNVVFVFFNHPVEKYVFLTFHELLSVL